MSIWRRIINTYKAWLLKMAAENQKQFNNSKPDCCSLLNEKKEA